MDTRLDKLTGIPSLVNIVKHRPCLASFGCQWNGVVFFSQRFCEVIGSLLCVQDVGEFDMLSRGFVA